MARGGEECPAIKLLGTARVRCDGDFCLSTTDYRFSLSRAACISISQSSTPRGPKLSFGNTPSLRKADDRVVVVTPKARRAPIGPLMPGVDGCVHGRMIEVLERHQDVGIVVACCGKTAARMSEHLPETRSGAHEHGDARSVVDHTVLSEQFNDLVIQSVIDAVRVAMDKIDDLVLVDQLPNRGQVSVHLIHDLHPEIGAHHACTVLPWIRCVEMSGQMYEKKEAHRVEIEPPSQALRSALDGHRS
jgi:hypothetical protein